MSDVDSSRMLLGKEELFGFCRWGSLSEGRLHEIFEQYGWTPDTHHISDYKFFHAACHNVSVTEGVIRCLLEYFPDAASAVDDDGQTPLHHVCFNKNVTLGIIQLLIDAAPDSVSNEDNDGYMPLHNLCHSNSQVEAAAAIQILKLLIEKCPEAVRHADSNGGLPIHFAADTQSPEFCRVLIETYPGSEQIPDGRGALPLHDACGENTVATVQYLYQKYPGAIDHATTDGFYPIHYAIDTKGRGNPADAVRIIRLLLNCGPKEKLKRYKGMTLLYYACSRDYNYSTIEVGIQIIKTLYDAHPEAIESTRMAANIQHFHQQVQEFINGELVYARQSKAHRLMITLDNNGQLPLHRALQNNVRLGSIKLLVKGNPSAIRTSDNNLAMPLHIACEHHDSVTVVQYFLEQLDTRTLRAVDIVNNTVLHYACRGAKFDTIALLLEKYAASVSKQNVDGKLPIDLLWESNEVNDRESVEYTGSVWQLLRAHPEMLAISSNLTRNQPVDVDATHNRKKRKFGYECTIQ